MLGAYAVPLNWHFKPDEVAYLLGIPQRGADRPCRLLHRCKAMFAQGRC